MYIRAVPPNMNMGAPLAATSEALQWVLWEKFGFPGWGQIPTGEYFIIRFRATMLGKANLVACQI